MLNTSHCNPRYHYSSPSPFISINLDWNNSTEDCTVGTEDSKVLSLARKQDNKKLKFCVLHSSRTGTNRKQGSKISKAGSVNHSLSSVPSSVDQFSPYFIWSQSQVQSPPSPVDHSHWHPTDFTIPTPPSFLLRLLIFTFFAETSQFG